MQERYVRASTYKPPAGLSATSMRRPALSTSFWWTAIGVRVGEMFPAGPARRKSKSAGTERSRQGRASARRSESLPASTVLALPPQSTGGGAENSFLLVSSELLKLITILGQFRLRRFALLPSALFMKRSLRCQLGVLNFETGVLPSRTRTDALLSGESSFADAAVTRTRRFGFSSLRLLFSFAPVLGGDFASAHTPHLSPTAGEVGCPVCAQRPRPLFSSRACRLVRPSAAPIVLDRYRAHDG